MLAGVQAVAVAAPERIADAAGQNEGVPPGLNKFSRTITEPKSQGASQAQLYGTGLKEEDRAKPQV